jgi:hypothetical protein
MVHTAFLNHPKARRRSSIVGLPNDPPRLSAVITSSLVHDGRPVVAPSRRLMLHWGLPAWTQRAERTGALYPHRPRLYRDIDSRILAPTGGPKAKDMSKAPVAIDRNVPRRAPKPIV